MPFDCLTKPPTRTLADAAAGLGITPVPWSVLQAHRQAEMAKHPGSWAFHHQESIPMCVAFLLVITAACGVGGLLTSGWSHLYGWGPAPVANMVAIVGLAMAGFCFVVLVAMVNGALRVKQPAHWVETVWKPSQDGVPTEIAAMATQLLAAYPRARARVGRLVQNTVVFDPYLIIQGDHFDEDVCLGVWDGAIVLHQAQR